MLDINNLSVNVHSSIRVETSKGVLYFDPFMISDMKKDADYIFITHSHYDHMDKESINKIKKENTIFVMPRSIERDFKSKIENVNNEKIISLSQIDEMKITNDFIIRTIPAYNILKPFHPKMAGLVGYIVNVDDTIIYVAGDTDATKEANDVKCDIAFLPIGGTYTMNVKDAIKLANTIKPQIVIPTHYGEIVGDKNLGKEFCKQLNNAIECE